MNHGSGMDDPQPALTASNRVIGYRLTGIKVAKTCDSRVPSEKNGCHQPRFCVRCDMDVSMTRPIPGEGRGLINGKKHLHDRMGEYVC